MHNSSRKHTYILLTPLNPTINVLSRNNKNIRIFYLKNCHFWVVKFSVYLNRRVFVMTMSTVLVVTSALGGFGIIPVFDVWLVKLLFMQLARATRNKAVHGGSDLLYLCSLFFFFFFCLKMFSCAEIEAHIWYIGKKHVCTFDGLSRTLIIL